MMNPTWFPSSSFFQAILEEASEGFLIAEVESKKFVYANPTICKWLGYGREELLALSVHQIHPPEHLDRIIGIFMSQARGEIKYARSIPCLKKDNDLFWADINTFKIENEGMAYNIGIFSDASERIKTAETLDSTERLLKSILLAVPDQLIVIDRHMNIQFCNRESGRTGAGGGSAFSKFCYGRFHNLEEPCQDCCGKEAFLTGAVVEREVVDPNSNTTMEIRAFPIKDKQGQVEYVLEYARDVSEKRKVEEERKKFQQQIEQAQKLESLGVLAGGIAHDFNNLLSGILGNVDLARLNCSNPVALSHLDTALESMDRARALTHQLLSFAKGGAPVKRAQNLEPLIRKTASFALTGSNVQCEFDIEDSLHVCHIDPNQIAQVIENMVINAKQVMPDGGTIWIKAENIGSIEVPSAERNGGSFVRIRIIDQGPGIPFDMQQKVFDPFFTTKPNGTGLGLSVSYSIIKNHGGVIDVSSSDRGTTFTLFLPATVLHNEITSLPSGHLHHGDGRVLIMDDEYVVRRLMQSMLVSFGYEVIQARNGQEAVRLFGENPKFKAVFLDLTIAGGMGGKQAVDLIREMSSSVPIFVVSGYADDPIMSAPKANGFSASLQKPFTRQELAGVLNQYLP